MKKLAFAVSFLSLSILQASALVCIDLGDNLTKGKENKEVMALQIFLYQKGFLTVTPNGYFGNGTFSAVKKYQKSVFLSQSGNVFILTRAALKNETCNKKISVVDTVVATSSVPAVVVSTTTVEVTPNSQGLAFAQNSTHVKLATITIQSLVPGTISSLSIIATSTTGGTGVVSNFTVTDILADKIINGGPFFTFTNQTITSNQPKIYELYVDVGTTTSSQLNRIYFEGNIITKDSLGNSTTTTKIPKFSILISR
jgi:peptidoglycan hydrolase-like protein with peptidoglycan-binding domain